MTGVWADRISGTALPWKTILSFFALSVRAERGPSVHPFPDTVIVLDKMSRTLGTGMVSASGLRSFHGVQYGSLFGTRFFSGLLPNQFCGL